METDAALGRDFFPRPHLTDVLAKRLSSFKQDYRQNVGLIGRKFLGKSSILKNFLLTEDMSGVIPVYIDVGFEPFDRFLHKWMGALLHGILRSRTADVPEERREVIKRAKGAAKISVHRMREIRMLLRKGKEEEALQKTLSLTAGIGEELKKKVVLVIDEFHRLSQFGIKDAFKMLGREIMLQKDTLFIVASSAPETARHIFSEQLSLLFGNFEIVESSPLDFSECHEFITHRLGRSDLKRSLERFLLRITDGNPYYLDAFLQRIRHLGKEQWLWRLNENVFVEGITEELFFRSGLLHLRFLGLVNLISQGRMGPIAINVIAALAAGHKKIQNISRFVRRSPAEIKKALGRLADEGLVTRDYSMFCVSDALFAFWLREVYMLRELHFDLNCGNLADIFRTRLHHLIRDSETEDGKELPDRIVGLFERFKNDVVVLDGRRFRCPAFQNLRSKPSNGRVFPLHGETAQGVWMAQVVHEKMREDDVSQFLKDEQSLPKRPHQRIMIAVQGSDLNAKLMAKEKGIALWSLRDLNHLFKLYDQQKVIV